MVELNNGAKIRELQNSDENKLLLAAQRQAYSDAKQVDLVNAIVCLLIPIAVTLFQVFMSVPSGVLILIWFVTLAVGIILPCKSRRLINEAAAIQQRFDSVVFGLKFENVSHDNKGIKSKAKRYYTRHHSDASELGLDDWYSIELNNLKPGKAVAACQRQNVEWTKRLLIRSMLVEIIVSVALVLVLCIVIIHQNVDCMNLFFLFSIAEWIIRRIIDGVQTLRRVGNLSSACSFELSLKNHVIQAQDAIYGYRQSPYLVPDWLYALFKRIDEADAST